MTGRGPLLAPEDLNARLGAPKLTLIDATWTYPGGPEPKLEGCIAGAVAMDIDAVADRSSGLPHMLPSPADFEAFARSAGVRADGEVVVYDRIGTVSAPRAWWMFRAMGHPRVYVLDGGLPAWAAAGGAVEPGLPPASAPSPGDFRADPLPRLVADRTAVAGALAGEDVQVLDVRSAARFAGEAPEPRPGVRSGHMPGSLNAPWTELVRADGRLVSDEELAQLLDRAGVSLEQPVITTCGSGVTACIAALALEVLGHPAWAVYDGSWAEWGGRADTKVATGPSVAG
jgi:thiosulfate/3-mercaptopyruvate sulfurtransferase